MKNIVCGFLLLLSSSIACGNQLVNVGIEEHSKRADVIVVGTLDSAAIPFKNNGRDALAARFKVQAVLKGKTEGSIVLVPYLYASEASYSCCDPTKQYILFLSSPYNGIYYPVNGRFSVYEISGHPAESDGRFPPGVKK